MCDAKATLQNNGLLDVECSCGYADRGFLSSGEAVRSAILHRQMSEPEDERCSSR